MDEIIYGGVVTFRYTKENIELLLISKEGLIGHPKSMINQERNFESELLKEFTKTTGLDLFVISLDPVHKFSVLEKKGKKKVNTTFVFYAGIADPEKGVILKDEVSEYIWIDHLGGRNTLSIDDEVVAYENGRNWLYDHDEAALFLANNLQKLL